MAEMDVGDVAPAFELPQGGGGTLSLSSLKGKPVVLYFYPKDDTSGCTAEAIAFSGLKPQFAKAGAVVNLVGPDAFGRHLADEVEKWRKVRDTAGLEPN